MTHEEWLAERRLGIGGSDAAAIRGLSDYSSPYCVWADKTGRMPPKEDTEAMLLGRILEPHTAERFVKQTGLSVRRVNHSLVHLKYPFMRANIDRRIVGQRAGLECKSCSPYRLKEFEDGQYPQEYYVQCLHYLAVTGWDAWYLAVWISGVDFRIFRVERARAQADIDSLIRTEQGFWERYVLPDKPPPADGATATTKAIGEVYKTAVDKSIDLSAMEGTFVAVAGLNAKKLDLEREIERHKQSIKLAMGENTRAECSAWVANWKPRKDGVRVFSIKEK